MTQGYQDRVTLSAVGAVAMASWVTRCWSPASVAGVARPEPDVPEAPLVRAGRRLPVARPHFVRNLAGQALLFGSGDAAGSFSRSSARTMPFSFAHARTAAAVSLYSNRTRTNPFQVRNWSIDRSHFLPCRSPQKTWKG